MIFQMFHVSEPLTDEKMIHSFYIPGHMGFVCWGEAREIFPRSQFLHEMKYSSEQGGKRFVFQQNGVFQETDEEIPFSNQETGQQIPVYLGRVHFSVTRNPSRTLSKSGS